MLNAFLNGKSTVIKCIAGAFCITAIELTVGIIVNRWLGLGVWDYSGVRLNFMGQICLPYSLLWLLLCCPAFKLCDLIERLV